MPNSSSTRQSLNVGFISFRFAGTDGVSLETSKWAQVLESMGHSCYYFSGLSDRPADRSFVVPKAHFLHPETREYYFHFFGKTLRSTEDTLWIQEQRMLFRKHLQDFIDRFKLDLLIPQNLLSFPLNIPLSIALTEIIAETGIPTIAHHHDFTWERNEMLVNSIGDYIAMAIPPDLPSIQHVVINTQARRQLGHRTGLSAELIPNVMDFAHPPPPPDEYSADLRKTLAIQSEERFILQPTRLVQRKGIERAVELVSRLEQKACLVISHASGDNGHEYKNRISEYAQLLGVRVVFASENFSENRGHTSDGRKIYSLGDAYPHADLVTYPSLIEGFGNAFLEAVYYSKPIVVNNYPVFASDIRPKGFKVIEFSNYITSETVERTHEVLSDGQLVDDWVQENYSIALRYYSYENLREKLNLLLDNAFGNPT
jgi:glycosyltransferase involved in cell wall biosynthesis